MTRPVTGPGRLIAGRYRLQSQIGGGGMGTVWLARDELLGRQVAVKQILSPLGADDKQIDEQRQRALREGRIAARLSHPHAISVYDVALEGGAPWLVMEYLPSRSLAEVLTADGVLRGDQVAQIGAQVADALAATHAAGIVHRDVKPANILIGQGGRVAGLVKITDFGISHARGDVTLTQTGQITGTPAFLAPEVAQGHEMTEASDVFSLGATLYTCLEGTPPFGMEDNALGMLHRVAGGQITPPRRAGSLTVPLLRMLAADTADRPPMTEVRDELAKLAAGRDGDTTTVLLARTDLRPRGHSGTAVFPAGAAAATATPDAADQPTPIPAAARTPVPPAAPAAPPATTPAPATPPTPVTPPASSRSSAEAAPAATAAAEPAAAEAAAPAPVEPRRRRRGAWVAAAIGLVVVAGLVALWLVMSPDDPDRTAADSSPTTSEAAPSSSEEPASPEPEPEPEPAPTQEEEVDPPEAEITDPPADPLSAENVQAFLTDYHRQVVQDPAAAWELTGPTLRSAISRDNYIRYWNQFSAVNLSDVQAADGQTRVTGRLEWVYPGGRSESATRLFTLLVRDDGQLILDSETAP
jgi:serine/threonine protein kinase